MSAQQFHGRRAQTIENEQLRVTILEEGGHIAEIFDKRTKLNPLWVPPWPSIEPSTYDQATDTVYGAGVESKLLSGLMGHNLCLDMFGAPSAEEEAAGLTVHGEASVLAYDISSQATSLVQKADLPLAGLRVERHIDLHGTSVRMRETIENVTPYDRPIGWTEHVTMGPPFLEPGVTQFRASATRSKVIDASFGAGDYMVRAAEYQWPLAPRIGGGVADQQLLNDAAVSSAFTAHLMDPQKEHAYFVAYAPKSKLAFGYVWKQADFPWMGIWEENHCRAGKPWNSRTLTRAMEFGVSPLPESRRDMIDRGQLFGVPGYRWIPALGRLSTEYWAVVQEADSIPESLSWPATGK